MAPGVYGGGTLQITGTLTLDAQGDPNAVFIFQAASTVITASASDVSVINGAQPCNVYWQVGSSATLGTGSDFLGNVLSLTNISLQTGADVQGRLLARNGIVNTDTNTSTVDNGCVPIVPTPTPAAETSLCISSQSSRPRVRQGSSVSWTVRVRNCGRNAAENVVLSNRLLRNSTLRTNSIGGSLVDRSLLWDVGALSPGESRTFRFSTRVQRDAALGRRQNRACATAGNSAEVLDQSQTAVVRAARTR